MKKKAKEALIKTIREKWIPICLGTGLDRGIGNCVLCKTFACVDCIVYEKVDIGGCDGTPYNEWHDYAGEGKKPFDDKSQKLAEAELIFLINLLPKSYRDIELKRWERLKREEDNDEV